MDDRRTQILHAARTIATSDGLAGISVRNVAHRVGIGPSTLRYYFPTQQDLFDAALGQLFDAQLEDLRITDTSVPPKVRLSECMGQFLPASDETIWQLDGWFASYASALRPGHTEQGRSVLAAFTRHARERVSQWLSTLEAEGALRRTEPDRSATILLATVNGLALELITPQTPEDVETAHHTLALVIELAVIGARATHSPS